MNDLDLHVVPVRTYLLVSAALFLLLIATVGAALIDLGPLNIAVALAIAVAKTGLIALYFMHLRYASHLTRVFASAAFLWLAIMIAITLGDYFTRN